jgi:hypothetical protein
MNSLRGAAGLEAGKWNEDGLPILVVVLAKPADDLRKGGGRFWSAFCPFLPLREWQLSTHSCHWRCQKPGGPNRGRGLSDGAEL